MVDSEVTAISDAFGDIGQEQFTEDPTCQPKLPRLPANNATTSRRQQLVSHQVDQKLALHVLAEAHRDRVASSPSPLTSMTSPAPKAAWVTAMPTL